MTVTLSTDSDVQARFDDALRRADVVAAELRATAAERDRANADPVAEIDGGHAFGVLGRIALEGADPVYPDSADRRGQDEDRGDQDRPPPAARGAAPGESRAPAGRNLAGEERVPARLREFQNVPSSS